MRERHAGLVAGLGGLQVRRPRSTRPSRGCTPAFAGYIFVTSMPAALFNTADARAGRLGLRAPARRHRAPVPFRRARYSASAVDLAVLGGQPLHHVIDRHQLVGVVVDLPAARSAARRGRCRPAPRRAWVSSSLLPTEVMKSTFTSTWFFARPGVALLACSTSLPAGHPMVPEAHRQLAGGAGRCGYAPAAMPPSPPRA